MPNYEDQHNRNHIIQGDSLVNKIVVLFLKLSLSVTDISYMEQASTNSIDKHGLLSLKMSEFD